MINRQDGLSEYLNIANGIFKKARYQASDNDIENLAKNMLLLKARGLSKLNRRLIDGGRNIWDTFSEHNFASILVSHISQEIPISYEPENGLQRRPDFKIIIGKLTYWVQVKKLSELEYRNRQGSIVREIEKAVQKIKIGKFYGLKFSEQFSESHIPDFVNFIAKCAPESIEGKEYSFPNDEEPIAQIDFLFPNKSKTSSLPLCCSAGDMDKDMVEVTGRAENQIRRSLINAAKSFERDVEQYIINLVVIDADNKPNEELCDAIFGTTLGISRSNKLSLSWRRQNDGFFNLPDFSNKVAGVIAIKRKESNPVSNCFSMLFINDNFKDRLSDIGKLILCDKVIYTNMRPTMGKGNFDLVSK